MNETENKKSCNSVVFENGAMELSYGMITSEDVEQSPMILGQVEEHKVTVPEAGENGKATAERIGTENKTLNPKEAKKMLEDRLARGYKTEHKKVQNKAKEQGLKKTSTKDTRTTASHSER